MTIAPSLTLGRIGAVGRPTLSRQCRLWGTASWPILHLILAQGAFSYCSKMTFKIPCEFFVGSAFCLSGDHAFKGSLKFCCTVEHFLLLVSRQSMLCLHLHWLNLSKLGHRQYLPYIAILNAPNLHSTHEPPCDLGGHFGGQAVKKLSLKILLPSLVHRQSVYANHELLSPMTQIDYSRINIGAFELNWKEQL